MGSVGGPSSSPADTFSGVVQVKATELIITGSRLGVGIGHMQGVPFLKDIAGTVALLGGIVKDVRTNKEAFEELLKHIAATAGVMQQTAATLEEDNTPLSPELKAEIEKQMKGTLDRLKIELEKRQKRNLFTRVRKHDADKRQIQDYKTEVNQLLQLFKMRIDISNAQRMGMILDKEKDLYNERHAREMKYREMAVELEDLRKKMALDQERRDEEDRIAIAREEEQIAKEAERIAKEGAEREMKRREAEQRMAELKKKRANAPPQAPAKPPPMPQVQQYDEDDIYEGSEDDRRTDIVDEMDKMDIDDDRQSQISGISGGRNSPRASTRIPSFSPPASDFGSSQNGRSSPRPQSNPLPRRPSARPKPPPVQHDEDDVYDYDYNQQGGYDDRYPPPPPASGRYGSRRDDDFDYGGYGDGQQSRRRSPPRQYRDEDQGWRDSGYESRRPGPGRRPRGPYGPPPRRPDYDSHRGNTAPAAGLDHLLGRQSPQPRSGSGPVITIGSGNITGNYISNVGNTTTTYVNGGPSYGRSYGRW